MNGRSAVRVGIVAACLLTLASPLAAQTRNVLILYGERSALPGIQIIDQGLVDELRNQFGSDVQIYREDLDASRFGSADHVDRFTAYIETKYARVPIDAIVPIMAPAVDAALHLRGVAFAPDVPIVFWRMGLDETGDLPPNVTGAYVHPPYGRTLELALDIHPETERVVVIAGESSFGQELLRYALKDLRPFRDRVAIEVLSPMPMDSVLAAVSRLGPETIVLYSTILRDGAGRGFVAREAARMIGEASAVPMYGITGFFLGYGIVGGRMHPLIGNGETLGELVAQSLGSAGVPPPVDLPSGQAMFDDAEMKRWGIAARDLPPDAVVLNSPLSWFGRNWMVLTALAAALLEGAIIAGLLVARRQRRAAEAKLRENEKRFRTLADRAPVMIWMTDADERFVFLNRTWLDFTGRSLGDQLNENWSTKVHPQDREACAETLEASRQDGEGFSVESRMRRYDGQWRWVLCTGVPRHAANGEYLGHIGTCLDITHRKEAELSGIRHAEELARVSRVATMGAFTASIAHELNQPLTAILSNAEASRRFLAKDPPPLGEVDETLGDISSAARRAGEIIRGMRRLLERHEVHRSELDLNAVVGEVLQLVRLEAQARRVAVEFAPGDLEVTAFGDRVHIQQVLMNLALNAFEAMEAVPKKQRRLVVTTRNGSGLARVSVADSGPGIPPEQLPRLFEAFHTTKNDGLGMGLSISRTIVEAHGGEIWAENASEGGAVFHVVLPAEVSSAATPKMVGP